MIVSFSGIDGAGKSTQISGLISCLESRGLRIKLLTFWDDVATLKQMREGAGHKIFKGDKGVGSPETPIERRDKNIQSPLMSVVRLGLYFMDALSLRRVAAAARHSGADVVIFDRYIYDELANLNLESSIMRLYIRCIMRLAPKPEIGFVLDADPAKARARKPEYPLDFLTTNRNSYLRLSRLLGGITVISPAAIEDAKAEVINAVSSALPMYEPRNDSGIDPTAKTLPV
jgi:thymidylate kinase